MQRRMYNKTKGFLFDCLMKLHSFRCCLSELFPAYVIILAREKNVTEYMNSNNIWRYCHEFTTTSKYTS